MLLKQFKSLWSAIFPPMMTVAASRKLIEDMARKSIALLSEGSEALESERDSIHAVLTSERAAHIAKLGTMIEKDSALEIINRSMRAHAEETESLLDIRLKHLQSENAAALDDLNVTMRHARAEFTRAILLASTRGSAIVAEAPGLTPADRRALLEVFRAMHAGAVSA